MEQSNRNYFIDVRLNMLLDCLFILLFFRVAELSKCVDMELKPTDDELIETFLNKQEILKLIKEPVNKIIYIELI